ncbi:hypothetical protein L211DRAFT_579025 [Terfezia boudieri ATCC MYA-4762]|uniref:Uncharacterized protein n=1 Tax=Terfezia boudieri ATCC MYA-4762 TaxID=1051890 RepID=A0A3N4LPX0_9PEZI|nr:hypothetical protein L211DRAFT_579025 [Terfezia boudieri ATCC MYA-4762]
MHPRTSTTHVNHHNSGRALGRILTTRAPRGNKLSRPFPPRLKLFPSFSFFFLALIQIHPSRALVHDSARAPTSTNTRKDNSRTFPLPNHTIRSHSSSPPSKPHQDYSHTSCSCSHCLLSLQHAGQGKEKR